MNEFAERLRSDRREAGLTVREVAELSGISFSYITKIETGRSGSGVSPEIVTALAKALQRDELEYLYLSGVVPPPLNDLLADGESRSFVRALLASRLKSKGWERLRSALSGSSPTSSGSRTQRKPKSRRKAVA
ncbi:anaerobic benzoate catabolism transcriptional regulator [Thalassoglobus neptunius]|uniref:Anaerobic benzoate catabolism transcriptional regulator n=1 Tax=Thalassoglobus neptunius TaxID=1938619 RepID=A0A5C5WM88_9PLAN|nr:helix-turn-helix transcriptional regulator [Thalassoglobus neptunius]TWT51730.1 anaerobic benzoate catabolism transcriptional regulator [Thalassoglobus neptunius]